MASTALTPCPPPRESGTRYRVIGTIRVLHAMTLLGFPAISIPIDCAPNGLPLGLQLAAPLGADDRLLAVAAWCEARLPFTPLP